MSSEDKGKLSPKRDRYWSVMLVGDHGRVIPFRHFKGLAITICIGFVVMLIAIVVMGILYTHQTKKLTTLQARISKVQKQNSKLRDEKDLYLTRLMLKENKRVAKSEKPALITPAGGDTKEPAHIKEEVKEPKKPAAKPEKPSPVKKQPAKNNWMADIRNFSVSYDAKQETLKAQFRIYNTSKPKKPLSGRSVIVFKYLDDPPIKWLSVPQMQLEDGKPRAGKGQPFQIRNYFTMRFRAYRQKAPIRYNSVTAYVFSSEGKLLASKDLAVKIDVPLPEPEKKEPPKPDPSVENKPEPPVQEAVESAVDKPTEASPLPVVPSNETGGTGTALPKPDTAPTTENETAPTGQTPNTPDGATTSDESPPGNRPESGTDKESMTPPKPTETVPKP